MVEARLEALTSDDRAVELRLREQFNRLMVRGASPAEVMQAALGLMEELAGPLVTRALFLDDLQPAAFESPQAEKLRNYALLQVPEPLVRDCWERQAVTVLVPSARPRLLEGEEIAVALPVPRTGVLYLSRASGSFDERAIHRLSLLAGQLGPVLAFSRRYEALTREAEQARRSERTLQQWVAGLQHLLEGAGKMASSLESGEERVLAHLEETLRPMAPEGWFAIRRLDREGLRGQADPAELERVRQAVERNRQGFYLEDRAPSAPQLWPGQRSLLVVPLATEDRLLGFLALGAPAVAFFPEAERRLIAVLAFQAAIALANASLHAELSQAYQNLQESRLQLVQSSKLAAVGELAAGVAHELNTPLGTILLAVEGAQLGIERGKPELAEKKLKRAYDELLRSREIVAKLLYYSRDAAKAGRNPVSPGQIITDTLDLLGAQIPGLETDLAETGRVKVNSNEIQQVLTNLLLNARDAGGGRIRVELRPAASGATIAVQDNGSGIDPEVIERIFDPFFTTKDVGRGTGLGLSISKQIVEAHGGTLQVVSRPGQGARFEVWLPGEAAPG